MVATFIANRCQSGKKFALIGIISESMLRLAIDWIGIIVNNEITKTVVRIRVFLIVLNFILPPDFFILTADFVLTRMWRTKPFGAVRFTGGPGLSS